MENTVKNNDLLFNSNYKSFEIDFDKVKTIEDIKTVLKAMQLVISWHTKEVPNQFMEIESKGMLKEKLWK